VAGAVKASTRSKLLWALVLSALDFGIWLLVWLPLGLSLAEVWPLRFRDLFADGALGLAELALGDLWAFSAPLQMSLALGVVGLFVRDVASGIVAARLRGAAPSVPLVWLPRYFALWSLIAGAQILVLLVGVGTPYAFLDVTSANRDAWRELIVVGASIVVCALLALGLGLLRDVLRTRWLAVPEYSLRALLRSKSTEGAAPRFRVAVRLLAKLGGAWILRSVPTLMVPALLVRLSLPAATKSVVVLFVAARLWSLVRNYLRVSYLGFLGQRTQIVTID
jgi:hypothetical protein